jgi:hypothetical protein
MLILCAGGRTEVLTDGEMAQFKLDTPERVQAAFGDAGRIAEISVYEATRAKGLEIRTALLTDDGQGRLVRDGEIEPQKRAGAMLAKWNLDDWYGPVGEAAYLGLPNAVALVIDNELFARLNPGTAANRGFFASLMRSSKESDPELDAGSTNSTPESSPTSTGAGDGQPSTPASPQRPTKRRKS